MTARPPSSPLEGTTWNLVAISDGAGDLVQPVPGSNARLEIDGTRIAGNASCNRFFCDGRLDAVPDVVGLTMMMCPEPVMEQERHNLDLLTRIDSWTIDGNRLTAQDETGLPILVWSAGSLSRAERAGPRAV